MNENYRLLLLALTILMIMSITFGCTSDSKDNEISENKPTQFEEIKSVSDINNANLTLLDSCPLNIYGDDEDEIISMYTAAERDSEGNIGWDDGQKWKLVVEGKDKSYILFDDYLQLASLEFFVYSIEGIFYISTVNSGTANLTLTDYIYRPENETFEKIIKSNTSGNVNMIYKSKSDF